MTGLVVAECARCLGTGRCRDTGCFGTRITGLAFAGAAVSVADNVQEWISHDRH